MIWYRAILTDSELQEELSSQLETNFDYLFRQLNQPDGMALYRSSSIDHLNLNYYMKLPECSMYNLGRVFNQFRIRLTQEPQKSDLMLVVGNEGDCQAI